MNEWEFAGDVCSWINEILAATPIPPIERAKIEQSRGRTRKRSDLTLLDKSKRPIITGEIKLPYQKDGGSPHNAKVVKDARRKARTAKVRFFFTWNVNECVLWETEPGDPTKLGQDYRSWHVTDVHNDAQLTHVATEDEVRLWLVKFLHHTTRILQGEMQLGRKSPDEKFVEAVESALKMPIQASYDSLAQRYAKKRDRARIDKWMREEQGWIIYDDPQGIRENLQRAAKFACYNLVNRLVFHEALLKRHSPRLKKFRIPAYINTGETLWGLLEKYFKDAIEITGDYETVFGTEHLSEGHRIPFDADEAVPHWQALIDQIQEFDFSKMDHEVIGVLFERLLAPEERHKYGQYYTRVEVVDLINSFSIRTGNERLMDPACGGGTFLVRAYSRIKWLQPQLPHGEILKKLYGVDLMDFAAHLSTMNLAVRDLVDDENYPQIVRSDFFDVEVGKTFAVLPRKAKAGGLGKTQREVKIPELDAIVGNPPYIRQEEIPNKRKPKYQEQVKREAGADLSGRSDIHCYFWPHATTFLKSDGYLCLITSSQWLDVEYGFKLQEWILRNFEIVAVLESVGEPWFVGARVATTVTILRRQKDEAARMRNAVRFVQLRRPIAEIMGNHKLVADAMSAANEFRDELLAITENTTNERYRARVVSQGELWRQGVQLGVLMGKSTASASDDIGKQDGEYYGGKWGIHLRAPGLWFKLLDDMPDSWSPLGDLAKVHRGITSGKDSFFYVRDCSAECLEKAENAKEFEADYGVQMHQVKSGALRLVRCGEGQEEIKPIEAQYLTPEVHSLMEISRYRVGAVDCNRLVLQVGSDRRSLRKSVLQYISWGEKKGYDKGKTCAARVTEGREWYDLTDHPAASVLWPKERQYRHIAPSNPERLIANCRLYEVVPPKELDDDTLWGGLLNSTWVLLSSLQYGRPVGNEGNWSTMVVDVNMMLVPNPRQASAPLRKKVADAFLEMKDRKALQFLSERRLREMAYRGADKEDELENLSDKSELDMPDRRVLDDAVLQMLGVKSKRRRNELIAELYAYLRDFFEQVRRKEEVAIKNKNLAKRRMRLKPSDIAEQILEHIKSKEHSLLREYDPDFLDHDKPYKVFNIPDEGFPKPSPDLFNGSGLTFMKSKKNSTGYIKTNNKAQDDVIILLVETGHRSLMRVPCDASDAKLVLQQFSQFIRERDARLRQLVEERTADEDFQDRILDALQTLLLPEQP